MQPGPQGANGDRDHLGCDFGARHGPRDQHMRRIAAREVALLDFELDIPALAAVLRLACFNPHKQIGSVGVH